VSRRLVSTPAGWWAVAVGAAVAAAASLAAATHTPAWLGLPPGAAALALLGASLRSGRRRLALVALVLGAAAAGLIRGTTAASAPSVLGQAARSGTLVLTGTVREGTGARRSSSQVVVDVDHVVGADGEVSVHGGVLAGLRSGPRLLPGDRVELDTSGVRPPKATGSEAALGRDGVEAVAASATVTVLSEGGPSPARLLAVARLRLAAAVDGALPEPASSLVKALAFALPSSLPPDLTASLRDSGLAHMLATSGLKVVLVAGLVGSLLAALATPPRIRFACMAGAVGVYITLCGASPAAVRSALMAGVGWALHGTGRSADPLPLLTTIAAAMILVTPELGRDVGFQLTFLGTLGILLFAGPLAERLPGPRLLREPFAVTLAASTVTLPVMASTFGVISFAGPLANALAVPLLAPLLVLAGIGAALASVAPMLGFIPLQVAGALAGAIATIARWTAGIPLAAVHVPTCSPVLTAGELAGVAAAGVAWHAMRRRTAGAAYVPLLNSAGSPASVDRRTQQRPRPDRRVPRPVALAVSSAAALLAGSVVVVAANRPDGRLHVSVLDVGAARADLVQTATGDRALVDTASDAQHLLDALGPALPPLTRSLGMVVLTSGDRLGAGGLSGLAGRYPVARAVAVDGLATGARSALAALSDRGTEVTTAAPGTAWSWGGATWRLLPVPGSAQPATALHVEDPTGSALLVGNLDASAQDELAGLDATALAADLLVAPPGGALAPTLVAATHPTSIAVPSAHGGKAAPTTLVAGPGVRRTGDSGTLTYIGGDGGLTST
jgi:ComEC/Rec2-related protein